MTIHFFTKGDRKVASSRQRAFLVAENLAKWEGIKTIIHNPPINQISETSWPGKLKLIFASYKNLSQVHRTDVIFVQRAIQNKYFFVGLVFSRMILRRKLVFDFDDAIYRHSPYKTRIIVSIANAVIAGSHALKEWAEQYNHHVYLVPTLIDYERYALEQTTKRNTDFTIGWIGNGPAHFNNLSLLVPVFSQLVEKGINFQFVLIGSSEETKVSKLFHRIHGMRFICMDWNDSIEMLNTLRTFTIGVMPLIDTAWNKGKCAFKAIEYMAAGIPTIVSPVGENRILIRDGENGFFADTTSQWIEKIELLYRDIPLREEIGCNGQKTIRDKYSFRSQISNIRSIIESI